MIKLNTNESPYPPGPATMAALSAEEAANLRLYSDPDSSDLKQAIADLYRMQKNNIFVSNGSDDILNFAFMARCISRKYPMGFMRYLRIFIAVIT